MKNSGRVVMLAAGALIGAGSMSCMSLLAFMAPGVVKAGCDAARFNATFVEALQDKLDTDGFPKESTQIEFGRIWQDGVFHPNYSGPAIVRGSSALGIAVKSENREAYMKIMLHVEAVRQEFREQPMYKGSYADQIEYVVVATKGAQTEWQKERCYVAGPSEAASSAVPSSNQTCDEYGVKEVCSKDGAYEWLGQRGEMRFIEQFVAKQMSESDLVASIGAEGTKCDTCKEGGVQVTFGSKK